MLTGGGIGSVGTSCVAENGRDGLGTNKSWGSKSLDLCGLFPCRLQ